MNTSFMESVWYVLGGVSALDINDHKAPLTFSTKVGFQAVIR